MMPGDQPVRRHVEGRVPDVRPFRREPRTANVRHFLRLPFLNRNG
jgi:hypothetical protein